jgi:hypothetical protein
MTPGCESCGRDGSDGGGGVAAGVVVGRVLEVVGFEAQPTAMAARMQQSPPTAGLRTDIQPLDYRDSGFFIAKL